MPEGHTIHRLARLHRRRFAGQRLAVSSPQGRFAAGASVLDGRRLEDVEAAGKHLFYRWEDGEILHVHLGLFGKFRTFAEDPPPPTPGTRVAWHGEGGTLYLAGPTVCEIIGPDDEEAIRARIGPDPLQRSNGQLALFAANLRRRTVPIGAALLDQKAVAGIGNVYRAELLFLTGINPARKARQLTDREVEEIWSAAVDQLRAGEKSGRIVTVDPREIGAASRRALARGERLYVYKRDGEPCRRCGTEIQRTEMAGRFTWWCPGCQPP
jgi:DNA-formamidopyrimidine glycosylase